MVDKNLVMNALDGVKDPEIGASITKLNMIKDVLIEGEKVKVKVALTIAGCPLSDTIETDVTNAVMQVPGVKNVQVELTHMTEEERGQLAANIRGSGEEGTVKKTWAEYGQKFSKKSFKRIIAVVSAKGGVGKSFVTSSLACELNRMGYKVGILDADLTGASIAHVFGIEGSKVYEAKPAPPETKNGIKVISINFLLEDPELAVMWRGPLLTNALRQFYENIQWGELDFLLLDMPPGSSDIPLTVFQFFPIDGIVIVTSPQELVKKIVSKAINMSHVMNVPIYGMIENMSYAICEHCGGKMEVYGQSRTEKFADGAKIPFLGSLSFDSKIAEFSDKGKMEEYSNEAFVGITKKFLESLGEQAKTVVVKKKGILGKIVG